MKNGMVNDKANGMANHHAASLWFVRWLAFGLLLACCCRTTQANSLQAPPGSVYSAAQLLLFNQTYQQKSAQDPALFATDANRPARYINPLILTDSPYLLRHAINPIDWQPWSASVLAQAKAQNKLIFLSIGYSTCHWCHVMEQDSFIDTEIGLLLNQYFIPVKVDRELNPAIDGLYSEALQQMTGSAGWPITAVLNEKAEPVFINAFLPQAKLKQLLTRLSQLWQTNRAALNQNASALMALVTQKHQVSEPLVWQPERLDNLWLQLQPLLDKTYGGFAGAPKFPQEALLLMLLDRLTWQDDPPLSQQIKLQLDQMITKGMYDHVNGGFHRYATDQQWRVPHFEKMLYNQAQLLLVYSQALRVYPDGKYQRLLIDIKAFVKQWLYQPNEGFYSAIDAQYQGVDGGYYTYTATQLATIPTNLAAQAGLQRYEIGTSQRSGIYFQRPFSDASEHIRQLIKPLSKQQHSTAIASVHQAKPHIDRKVVTAWNGLMIWGLLEAYQATGDKDFLVLAQHSASRVWQQNFSVKKQQLYRARFNGQSTGVGQLQDYSYLAKALVRLYDLTAEPEWLARSQLLVKIAIDQFQDPAGDFWSMARSDNTALNHNASADGELLSAVAVMVESLQDLWHRVGGLEQQQQFELALNALKRRFLQQPLNHLYGGYVIHRAEKGPNTSKQYFARGKGSVSLTQRQIDGEAKNPSSGAVCRAQSLSLAVNLAPGWHINSTQPLQPYLRPTRLTGLADPTNKDSSQGYQVNFPPAQVIKVGFEAQPLSVFSGQFKVTLARTVNIAKPLSLVLEVQACSDTVCLLPEQLHFYVGPCPEELSNAE